MILLFASFGIDGVDSLKLNAFPNTKAMLSAFQYFSTYMTIVQ